MDSFLGLDLAQKGLSLYTVPAALVVAMIPHTYASLACGKLYDPANPRKLQATLTSEQASAALDKITKARILRGNAAAANAFETLGFYSAAVVAANAAGVDAKTLNVLTFGYVASRLLYTFVYVRLQDNRKFAPLRSIVWVTGIIIAITLYVKAAAAMAASSSA